MFFGGLTIAINGFSMVFGLAMVFDGFGPLVKRCDGFDGSSWSKLEPVESGKTGVFRPHR